MIMILEGIIDMGFRGTVWGLLTMILGIAILYFTAFQAQAFSDMMPDTYLKILFWVGYIGQSLMAVAIKPFLIIARDEEGSPFGVAQGVFAFIIGIFVSLILYYVMEAFFGTSGVFYNDVNYESIWKDIIWFGYVIVTVIAMIIAPLFLAWDEPLTEKVEELVTG